jgi:nucleoside phosphorylase
MMTLLLENEILLVAATELELCGHPGFVCGVGPVEAAVTISRELAMHQPRAVINVGIGGSRGLTPGSVVVGSEAFYCDLGAEIPIVDRVQADPELVAEVQAAVPEAVVLPIATSAYVTGSQRAIETFRVEGMEGFGVLRACELAGVPGVEVRVISNDIGEGNRALWMMRRALEVLDAVMPRLLGGVVVHR